MIDLDDIGALAADAGTCFRMGIMGGTFDPIHIGHLYCAEQAADRCGLDAVIFMPAGNPSFKRQQRQAPIAERLALCELAVSSNPRFFVSDIEADESRITYTIDTMRRLRSIVPENASIEFIAGSDAIDSLHLWREADMLASLCGFICVCRPYASAPDAQHLLMQRDKLEQIGFRVQMVEAPMLDVSSSDIRERIRDGRSIRYMVPEDVRERIYADHLYRQ